MLMSRVARRLVFGDSDQVGHKPGCTSTELEAQNEEGLHNICSENKDADLTGQLIWSFVFASSKSRFSLDVKHHYIIHQP